MVEAFLRGAGTAAEDGFRLAEEIEDVVGVVDVQIEGRRAALAGIAEPLLPTPGGAGD